MTPGASSAILSNPKQKESSVFQDTYTYIHIRTANFNIHFLKIFAIC
jgi:hypothetical protein